MTMEILKTRIDEILKKMWGINEDGGIEIYTDYRERELSDSVINKITSDGYSISYYDSNIFYGSIQTIIKDKAKGITGGADYRRRGEYKVKY